MPTISRLALAWPRRRPPADDDRRIQLLGPDHFGRESAALESRDTAWCLAAAGLDQQVPTWREPTHRARRNSSVHIEAVWTAVQRNPWLVEASFWWHQRDRVGGDIRARWQAAGRPDRQRRRKWSVEVTLYYASRRREIGKVPSGASHGGRIDIGGAQLGTRQRRGQRARERSRTATQLDDHWMRRSESKRMAEQQLGPPARHEDTGLDANP